MALAIKAGAPSPGPHGQEVVGGLVGGGLVVGGLVGGGLVAVGGELPALVATEVVVEAPDEVVVEVDEVVVELDGGGAPKSPARGEDAATAAVPPAAIKVVTTTDAKTSSLGSARKRCRGGESGMALIASLWKYRTIEAVQGASAMSTSASPARPKRTNSCIAKGSEMQNRAHPAKTSLRSCVHCLHV